jgi:hypothetical protein
VEFLRLSFTHRIYRVCPRRTLVPNLFLNPIQMGLER